MQLAERSLSASTSATDRATQAFSGSNQTAYLRLKLALSLNLRRQIFLAVCDDVALRNRIAARLYAELAYPASKPTAEASATGLSSGNAVGRMDTALDQRLWLGTGDRPAPAAKPPTHLAYPRLVSLNLNLSDPNPMVQIGEWLAQYPPPNGAQQRGRSPGFQILGAERLTRQAAPVQKRFLSSLQRVEHYLSCLESALLLWLPRPWLHAVQQSAPDFWNWHTALFEFEGDPTPAPALFVRSDAIASPTEHPSPDAAIEPDDSAQGAIAAPTLHQLAAPASPAPVEPTASAPSASETLSAEAPPPERATASESEPQAPIPPKENLWDILSHDLARLQTDSQHESVLSVQSDADQLDVSHSLASPDHHTPVPPAEPIASESPPPVAPLAVNAAAIAITPPHQNHAVLELTDLLLAVAAEETGEQPSSADSRIMQALQQIEQLHLQEAPNATLLAAYQNLGNICRDRVEQGNASAQHLLLTIRVHEQMLQWLDESSPLWSDLLNDIGNLYWMLSRHGLGVEESLAALQQAIAVYHQALQKTNPQTRPNNYAMIQNNLGSAYGDMARFDAPAENLLQAVQAYEAALHHRRLTDDPARYAATQNNLGTAYWNLAQYQQPVRRLKQSIAAYFEALRYYSPDCEPIHYAMIQNNLGTAYWNLAQQPQANLGVATAQGKSISAAELLQRAIAAYRAALVYRTLEVAPAAYAATQNNLGTAYWQLASLMESQPEQRQGLLQQAVAAYKAAIAAVQYLAAASTIHAPALSFDPAATHNNLGLAYYQLATDKHHRDDSKQRFAHLEAALHHHLKALQSWEPQSELYQTVFSYVVQTVRSFHSEFGTRGQTQALSQMPPHLLPEVLKRV